MHTDAGEGGGGKETLGELEELVLLAMVRLGEEAYGLGIVDELAETAGRAVSRSSVYVLLRRLERAGLISSHREPPDEARGRPRRLVRPTDRGLELLRSARKARMKMWDGIEATLEGS
ncbi:MAG: helix-turn-helix transcriptional regulator [Gemmatimonadota bacterium]